MTGAERQKLVEELGHEIANRMKDESASIFRKDWWSGKMLDWCMQNETFKVEMFRFIDVLPYLQSSEEVARHIKEYFLRPGLNFPGGVTTLLGAASFTSFTAKIAPHAIKRNVSDMARNFITGENPQEALKTCRRLRDQGLSFSMDILGEAAVSEEEAHSYLQRYLELMDVLADEAKDWKTIPQINTHNP